LNHHITNRNSKS